MEDVACMLMILSYILYCNTDLSRLVDDLNNTLSDVSEWYKANRLVLNVSKSNSMLIGSNANCNANDFNVSLNGNQLICNETTKYLGLYIDDHLNLIYMVMN